MQPIRFCMQEGIAYASKDAHIQKEMKMKAFVYHEYGGPEVLQLTEVERPNPQMDEVLVKIHAISVNPAEWHSLAATNVIVRAAEGLRKPKKPILGADFSGIVQAVGADVSGFQAGDAVYGRSQKGGFAEYVAIPQHRMAMKPGNLSFAEAAAVPLGSLTALQGLRKGGIKAGQRVLINGASGGIGTFMVQLARIFEAEVTGVCSTRNVEMVHSLGAQEVIDYTREALVNGRRPFDLVLDNVGNLTVSDYQKLLTPGGACVVIGFEDMGRLFHILTRGTLVSLTSSQTIGVINTNTNQADLDYIRGLIEAEEIRVVIDRCYPFTELPEAMGYLSKKHARGKVVVSLEVEHESD